jgi:Uri superfamily endonuclease
MPRSANSPGSLPASAGTYVLVMRLDASATVTVGRLGVFDLPEGVYLYVGSAHGAGGLRARVGRHLRAAKRLHWHVDYLTAHARIIEVWTRASAERLECRWAGLLAGVEGGSFPAARFGASDCTCPAHLFRLPEEALPIAQAAIGAHTIHRVMRKPPPDASQPG